MLINAYIPTLYDCFTRSQQRACVMQNCFQVRAQFSHVISAIRLHWHTKFHVTSEASFPFSLRCSSVSEAAFKCNFIQLVWVCFFHIGSWGNLRPQSCVSELVRTTALSGKWLKWNRKMASCLKMENDLVFSAFHREAEESENGWHQKWRSAVYFFLFKHQPAPVSSSTSSGFQRISI